jgi:hypothetical protein
MASNHSNAFYDDETLRALEVDARNPDAGVGRRGFSDAPVGEPVQTGPRLG